MIWKIFVKILMDIFQKRKISIVFDYMIANMLINNKPVVTTVVIQKILRMIIKTATEVKIVKTVKIKTYIKMINKQQLLLQIM